MAQTYKCRSSYWEFLSLPKSSAHLRNTFSEMILLSITLPSGLSLDQENSKYQTQCHSNLKLVFQHSQVHHSLVALHWLLHTFWFLGHRLPYKLLHCKLAKVLLFAIGMQVQGTIYCFKSPFFDQVLSMHHQQDFLCLSHNSIGLHQSVLGSFVLD